MTKYLFILLTLLLSGCVSITPKKPANYGRFTDTSPCVIVSQTGSVNDSVMVCKADTTADQAEEWLAYHTEPSLDKCEEKQLKTQRLFEYGDVGMTLGLATLCKGVFLEANPLGIPLALTGKILVHNTFKKEYAKTSRWDMNHFDEGQCPNDDLTNLYAASRTFAYGSGAMVLYTCLL